MLEYPLNSEYSIFKKFSKRSFKNGFSGICQIVTETKSPILAFCRHYKHMHDAAGQIDPVLPEIGLSQYSMKK